jgi:ABC-type uncharacterized transport system substrate-binding protein
LFVSNASPRALRVAPGTIPIVACSYDDPVGAAHVASLLRSGGNVTGISTLLTELGIRTGSP